MAPKVGIADLKAHLSEYLRKVKLGETWVIVNRALPVAKLTPVNTFFEFFANVFGARPSRHSLRR